MKNENGHRQFEGRRTIAHGLSLVGRRSLSLASLSAGILFRPVPGLGVFHVQFPHGSRHGLFSAAPVGLGDRAPVPHCLHNGLFSAAVGAGRWAPRKSGASLFRYHEIEAPGGKRKQKPHLWTDKKRRGHSYSSGSGNGESPSPSSGRRPDRLPHLHLLGLALAIAF